MLSIDNTPSSVMVDPQQQQSIVDGRKGVSINPNVGKYDARVVVGASFSTQRQQAQAAYTEMMRASPQMLSVIGPLWAQTLDVPHADKLAQVLTAAAPDAVKAILQPNQQDSVPALKAQIEQLGQALQEAEPGVAAGDGVGRDGVVASGVDGGAGTVAWGGVAVGGVAWGGVGWRRVLW